GVTATASASDSVAGGAASPGASDEAGAGPQAARRAVAARATIRGEGGMRASLLKLRPRPFPPRRCSATPLILTKTALATPLTDRISLPEQRPFATSRSGAGKSQDFQ